MTPHLPCPPPAAVRRARPAPRVAATLALAVALATGRAARADTPTVDNASDRDDTRVALSFELAPSGSAHAETPQGSSAVPLYSAFGLGGVIERALDDHVAVGLSPRVVLGLAPHGSSSSMTEVDLRARLAIGERASPTLRVYAYGAPGYSFISLPGAMGSSASLSGPVLELGAGAAFTVAPGVFISAEAGYQLGYHQAAAGEATGGFDFPRLGVGLGASI